jgi:hypothetical protein
LWSALQAQHGRRGTNWLMKKGGLSRIDAKTAKKVVKSLDSGSFNVATCEEIFATVPPNEQMILLNLLGGKLPIGWRLCGAKANQVCERVLTKSDRTFRRIKRVAETLETAIQLGS